MTRKEAIELLEDLIGFIEDNQGRDYDTAFRMAIEALTQDSSQDLISRQAALDVIDKRIVELSEDPIFRRKHAHIDLYGAKKLIRKIPSAETRYMGCTGCVHYDQQQTALICHDCKRYYRDMYKEL